MWLSRLGSLLSMVDVFESLIREELEVVARRAWQHRPSLLRAASGEKLVKAMLRWLLPLYAMHTMHEAI